VAFGPNRQKTRLLDGRKIRHQLEMSPYTGQSGEWGWRLITKGSILVFVRIEHIRRVKAGRRTNPGRENQRQAFTPAVILLSHYRR
jgi:hypothetical protein